MIFLRPVRFFAQALLLDASPKQLAWGFALGMATGLVPKGNLIAIALMTLLCSLRVNLAAGTMAVFVFSWIGMAVDPVSHSIGEFLLSHAALQSLWTTLYDTPLVPWTAFNNTVVLGSFVLGLTLLYPACRLSEPIFAKLAPRWTKRVQKFRLVKLLWGGELTGKLA
jgi:uncharacterized protein (TIGR03546 family)